MATLRQRPKASTSKRPKSTPKPKPKRWDEQAATAVASTAAMDRDAYFKTPAGSIYQILCNLQQTLKENKHGQHRFAMRVREVLSPDDDELPDPGQACKVIDEWNALPEAERAELANGWTHPIQNIPAPFGCGSMHRCVSLHLHDAQVWSNQNYVPDDFITPVTVTIKHGTTKEEALLHLGKIREAISEHFQSMVQNESQEVPNRQPGTRSFYPHLTTLASTTDAGETNAFAIHDWSRHEPEKIATLIVDPGISPQHAARLAHFFSRAPVLWRSLREVASDL